MSMEKLHNGAFSVGDLFYTTCADSMLLLYCCLTVQSLLCELATDGIRE